MADVGGISASTAEKHQDFRVNVKSKRIVTYQLAKYKGLLMNLLKHQPELNKSDVEKMLQEMLLVSARLLFIQCALTVKPVIYITVLSIVVVFYLEFRDYSAGEHLCWRFILE